MEGLYTHKYRHCATCAFCKVGDRGARKRKHDALRESADTLGRLHAEQEPYASWKQVEGKIYEHTGVHEATFDLVVRSCREQLTSLHGLKTRQDDRVLHTPETQTLLLPMEESSSEEEKSEADSEEEDLGQYHEIDKIKSHRKGRAKGQPVIFYRVKFLDGPDRECTEDFITCEALQEYRQHHHVDV